MNREVLLKFISEQGYKRNSPDKNRPMNVIPSNRITMKDVDFPVHGIDDLGNEQLMFPEQEYKFPGNYVIERPVNPLSLNIGNLDIDARYRLNDKFTLSGGASYIPDLNKIAPRIGLSYTKKFEQGGVGKVLTSMQKAGTVKYGTEDYRKAFEEGNVAAYDEKTGTYVGPNLPEIEITAKIDKPDDKLYDYKYWDNLTPEEKIMVKSGKGDSLTRQHLIRKANYAPGEWLESGKQALQGFVGAPIMATANTLAIPQALMVEGIEALRGNDYDFSRAFDIDPMSNTVDQGLMYTEQRTPSQAWMDEDTPWYWKMGVDAIADPLNLVGVGFAKNAAKAGKYAKYVNAFDQGVDNVIRGKYSPLKKKPNLSMPEPTGAKKQYTTVDNKHTAELADEVIPGRSYEDVQHKMKNLRKDLGISPFQHWWNKNIKGSTQGIPVQMSDRPGILIDPETGQLFDSNTRYWLNREYGYTPKFGDVAADKLGYYTKEVAEKNAAKGVSPLPNNFRHLSDEPIESFIDMTKASNSTFKPKGLWFSEGDKWADFAETGFDRVKPHQYSYDLELSDKVKRLTTKEDLDEIAKNYPGTKMEGTIDWDKFKQDYPGFTIDENLLQSYRMEPGYDWVYALDVPGGSVWSPEGIKSFKPTPDYNPLPYEASINFPVKNKAGIDEMSEGIVRQQFPASEGSVNVWDVNSKDDLAYSFKQAGVELPETEQIVKNLAQDGTEIQNVERYRKMQQDAFDRGLEIADRWVVDRDRFKMLLDEADKYKQEARAIGNEIENNPFNQQWMHLQNEFMNNNKNYFSLPKEEQTRLWEEFLENTENYAAKMGDDVKKDQEALWDLLSMEDKAYNSQYSLEKEALDASVDPEFKRKVSEIYEMAGDAEGMPDAVENTLKGQKNKGTLVHLDESDPSFQSLSESDKQILREEYDRLGGVRTDNATITLGGHPSSKQYYTTPKQKMGTYERVREKPFNWKDPSTWTKKGRTYTETGTRIMPTEWDKARHFEVITNRFADPSEVLGISAHETGHDIQKLYNSWLKKTGQKYDPELGYYTGHEENALAKEYKDAMVEPKAMKPDGKHDYQTWLSSQGELHSELMKARASLIDNYMRDGQFDNLDDAIQWVKQNEMSGNDDLFQWYIDSGNLDKHFKQGVEYDVKKKLIQYLPAVTGISIATGSAFGDNPEYQYGGMTVSQIWEKQTGTPWTEAKKQGLTTGNKADNLALKQRLINGEFSTKPVVTPASTPTPAATRQSTPVATTPQQAAVSDNFDNYSSFADAFKAARDQYGANNVFKYKGRSFTTNVAGETFNPTPDVIKKYNLPARTTETKRDNTAVALKDIDLRKHIREENEKVISPYHPKKTVELEPPMWQDWGDVKTDMAAKNRMDNAALIIDYHKRNPSSNNFVIVDKSQGIMHMYKPDGTLLFSNGFDVDTGLNPGDEQTVTKPRDINKDGVITNADKINNKFIPDWSAGNRKTGAGKYYISNIDAQGYRGLPLLNMMNDRQYEKYKQTGKIENVATSFHKGFVNDNNSRVSNGCIRCSKGTLDQLVKNLGVTSEVYILPDNEQNRFVLENGKLNFKIKTEDAPINDRGEYLNPKTGEVSNIPYYKDARGHWQKGQGVNKTTHTLKSIPIKIDVDRVALQKAGTANWTDGYNDNQRTNIIEPYARAIENKKAEIMKAVGINGDAYNDVAEVALGVLGVETNFGDTHGYFSNMLRLGAKWWNPEGSSSPDYQEKINYASGDNNSVGLTQYRWKWALEDAKKGGRELEILKKLGITSNKDFMNPTLAAIATTAVLAYRYQTQLSEEEKKDVMTNLPGKWNTRANYADRVKEQSSLFYLRQLRPEANAKYQKEKEEEEKVKQEAMFNIQKTMRKELDQYAAPVRDNLQTPNLPVGLRSYQPGGEVIDEQGLVAKAVRDSDTETMLDKIKNQYPAIGNMGPITLKADTSFNSEFTGLGDIEYFSPMSERGSVIFPNGAEYKHPDPTKSSHGVVYNPLTNDARDVFLDLLHGLKDADPTYRMFRDNVKDILLGDYIEDFEKDYEADLQEFGEEKMDSREAYIENWVDGKIRNLLFEGSSEDFANHRYWQEAREYYLSNPEMNQAFTNLHTYLMTNDVNQIPSYTLPEVVITPEKGILLPGERTLNLDTLDKKYKQGGYTYKATKDIVDTKNLLSLLT